METYTQYIELINDYLNNILSKEARINFESKLQNDIEFNTIYQEHVIFINGLERIDIKHDIQNAKRSYYTEKWLKISGISILVIGALVMFYTLVFNTSEMEPTPNSENLNTIVIDSTAHKRENAEIKADSLNEKANTQIKHNVSYVTKTNIAKFGSTSTSEIEITKKSENFKLNTQNDKIITCKEGTILKIAKASFVNPKTGKTIKGKINLKVTEYYTLSDILLANLSTVSNGKQLETGGMLFIEAKQGAIGLKLKDDSPIEISFPQNI